MKLYGGDMVFISLLDRDDRGASGAAPGLDVQRKGCIICGDDEGGWLPRLSCDAADMQYRLGAEHPSAIDLDVVIDSALWRREHG